MVKVVMMIDRVKLVMMKRVKLTYRLGEGMEETMVMLMAT